MPFGFDTQNEASENSVVDWVAGIVTDDCSTFGASLGLMDVLGSSSLLLESSLLDESSFELDDDGLSLHKSPLLDLRSLLDLCTLQRSSLLDGSSLLVLSSSSLEPGGW